MNFTGEHLTRQSDLIPTRVLTERINIIGAGAIGSFTALSLTKMGYTNIKIWDFDTIDTVNMNSQFYRFKDIGKKKVEALRDLIKDFTNVEIEICDERWKGEKLDGIVLCCADSMAVRKAMFAIHKNSPSTKLYIDSRMGAELALLYSVIPNNPKSLESYEKTLYSDEEAVQQPCTAKSTVYCSLSLSSMICALIKEFTVNKKTVESSMYSINQFDFISSGLI